MSGNPNITGHVELQIKLTSRGGWVCDKCGREGAAHHIAVFVGARRGETKGRLMHGSCATKLGGPGGKAIKELVEWIRKTKETR